MMQRAFGLDIPQTLDDICDPKRLALIVYDMQVGIVKQIANGPQITNKVVQVLTAPRVTPQGIDGRISVPHSDGLATGEIARRSQTLVSARCPRIPPGRGNES